METYTALSALLVVVGISTVFVTWRDSTRLLPWNRPYNERYPGFLRWTFGLQRVGLWLIIVGLTNVALAVTFNALTS